MAKTTSAFCVALFFMLIISAAVECATAAGLTHPKFGAISRRKLLVSDFQASVTYKSQKMEEEDDGYDGDKEGDRATKSDRRRRNKRSSYHILPPKPDNGGDGDCRKKACDKLFPDEDICHSSYGCNYCDGKLCTNYPLPPSIPDDAVVVNDNRDDTVIVDAVVVDDNRDDAIVIDDNGDGGCPSKPCDELYPDVDICEDAYECNICDGRFCTDYTLTTPMDWE